MDPIDYKNQWRFRITKMRVYLLDNSKNIMPNNVSEAFKIGITYPFIFNDIDKKKVTHTFRAQYWYCRSFYQVYNECLDIHTRYTRGHIVAHPISKVLQ